MKSYAGTIWWFLLKLDTLTEFVRPSQKLELKDCTTRNNAINLWLDHNLMNKIHKCMTNLGKNHYNLNASTKSIILLHNNGSPCYIL